MNGRRILHHQPELAVIGWMVGIFGVALMALLLLILAVHA